ncbi:MAG: hypothetical protein QNJ62_05235 [Methyloceanibacter sp.]|nr:hypothetical protein [Methyloceanibacter sp.]
MDQKPRGPLRHWPIVATAVTLTLALATGAASVVDQLGRHDERITKLEQRLNALERRLDRAEDFMVDRFLPSSSGR